MDPTKPTQLSELGSLAFDTIVNVLKKHQVDYGGCTPFYSPEEWKARGEVWGTKSRLVIVYDGGSLGDFFNLDRGNPEAHYEMSKALERAGVYVEECTHWYSGVYPI